MLGVILWRWGMRCVGGHSVEVRDEVCWGHSVEVGDEVC